MNNSVEVRSICRSCWSGCGILIALESGERVISVRGDRDHPRSKGYICPKGNAIPWGHNRPDRLNYPSMYGRQASWDDTLDDLARKIRAAIDKHGPNAVGLYLGSGSDTLGTNALKRFVAALGTQQLFSPMTVDVAPAFRAAELVSGYAMELLPQWIPEDEDSKLLIFFGSNPIVSHGYVGAGGLTDANRLLRAFQKRGGTIWVIDPVETRTARLADEHIAPVPGTDAVILAWLVKQALAALPAHSPVLSSTKAEDRKALRRALEPFDLSKVAEISGVGPIRLQQLWKSISKAGRFAMPSGTGLTFGPHGIVSEWMRWALLILTDSLEQPGGMWFDPGWIAPMEKRSTWSPAPAEGRSQAAPASRPDLPRVLGETACAALADEIENGPLRVLVVLGGSPLTAIPDPQRMKRVLQSLDALAVIDLIPTPLTDIASHVLPGVGQLERIDLNGIGMSHPQIAFPVVKRVAERRAPWYIFAQIAKRLGLLHQVLDDHDPEQVSEEVLLRPMMAHARNSFDDLKAAGPHGLTSPRMMKWALERAVPDAKWRLAPTMLLERLPALLSTQMNEAFPLLLTCGRQERRVNSTENPRRPRDGDVPALHLTAEDAHMFGVRDGSQASIRSANGAVIVRAVVDRRMRRGVVSLAHGWHEANTAHLTDANRVDPLTTQPQMTAVPVTIVPVTAPG